MEWMGTLTTVGTVVIGAALGFAGQEFGARRSAKRQIQAERRGSQRDAGKTLLSDLTTLASSLRAQRDAQMVRREKSLFEISPDDLDGLQMNVRLLPSSPREILLHAIEGLWGTWIMFPAEKYPRDPRDLQTQTVASMQEIVSCFLTDEPIADSDSRRVLELYHLVTSDD